MAGITFKTLQLVKEMITQLVVYKTTVYLGTLYASLLWNLLRGKEAIATSQE